MKRNSSKWTAFGLFLAAYANLSLPAAQAAATITIISGDPPGAGFNDPTPVTPVGGNSGTTLGQQRMNVFTAAAAKWESVLTSAVPIRVNAVWTALTCSTSTAILGSAGPTSLWRDFPNAPLSGHWYPKALANKLAGFDIDPSRADISANFNVNIGQPGCLTGASFYLGLDNNHGFQIDLYAVVLHELAHGLGFATFTNTVTGAFAGGFPSIWDEFIFDNSTNKTWVQMTADERMTSAVNSGHLVWNGPTVTVSVPQVLAFSSSGFFGADGAGRARLYASSGGSGVSHYDPVMTPNQLMEPALNFNLLHEITPPFDLTYPLLQDIGWAAASAQFPTLSITKTHSGNFVLDQTGTYSILVTNTGNVATTGTVTVLDTLPLGLNAIAISGTGWNCSLTTLTCSRSDSLPPVSSYPVITLTVSVSMGAPAQVTNEVDVFGGGSAPAHASDPTSIQTFCAQLGSTSASVSAAAGTASVPVIASANCVWSAVSNTSWLTITSGSFGTGNGTVRFAFDANNVTTPRSGTLSIGGQTFTVNQAGAVPPPGVPPPPPPGMSLTGSISHIASGGTWKTTLNYLNLGSSAVQAKMNFVDDNGFLMTLPLVTPQTPGGGGIGAASTIDRTLNPNAEFIVETQGADNQAVSTGWSQLFGSAANLSGFGMFSNPTQNWEAVVPLEVRNSSRYILAFDNTGPLATGLAIANTTNSSAAVAVVIRAFGGLPMGTATINLPPYGHTSFMLNQQYPVTVNQRGTIEFQTPAGGRISVLGLRANGPSLTTLPVLADTDTSGGSIAHTLFNGDWTASYTLVNMSPSSASASLNFFAENGAPMMVPLFLPQTGESSTGTGISRVLPPGGSLLIQVNGDPQQPAVVGSARLTTTGNVGGFSIFKWLTSGQEASVPLESRNPLSYVLSFDNTGGVATGLALTEVNGTAVSVPVLIRDDDGTLIFTSSILLPGRGHVSFMLPVQYAATAGRRGTIEFLTSPGGRISVIGLRATPSGNVTTIPVMAK
jgi:uncharacterized repeat protein (TIGR01451 family)